MKRIALPTLIAAGLVVSQIARAHDGVDHEGKVTEGQIVSIADNPYGQKTRSECVQRQNLSGLRSSTHGGVDEV